MISLSYYDIMILQRGKQEERKMLNVKGMTRAQKKGLKELGKILYGNDTKFDFEPLENHPELIIREWISKKGVEFVGIKEGTREIQLRKDEIKYHKVNMITGFIH